MLFHHAKIDVLKTGLSTFAKRPKRLKLSFLIHKIGHRTGFRVAPYHPDGFGSFNGEYNKEQSSLSFESVIPKVRILLV